VRQRMQDEIHAHDPRRGVTIGSPIPATRPNAVSNTVRATSAAARAWGGTSRAERAAVLRRLAEALDDSRDELVCVADSETALGSTRLESEVTRTSGQLRMFAGLIEDGAYVDAVISLGNPDVRRMLFPLGAVAVYAASNFPFAFSVLGGDTASALAAGCTVVVKVHEGHPQTSARTLMLARDVFSSAGMDPELISGVYGFDAGVRLVQHPDIKAAGFTGSLAGGRALFDLAMRRAIPIPFYGELGSSNPVVISPGAARQRPAEIAEGYVGSLTLGGGQFCTKPGLLFAPDSDDLMASIHDAIERSAGTPMLTGAMAERYTSAVEARENDSRLLAHGTGTPGTGPWGVRPYIWRTTLDAFASDRGELSKEVFGPAGLLIRYRSEAQLAQALERLPGSLTGAVHATSGEHDFAMLVARSLRPLVGRLIYNGWPTGVAVRWAMQHGGPWPSSTAAAHTSVGARAITRWLTPTAFQDWPESLLPIELRTGDPGAPIQLVERT
jgi:NADP-dependent aldehyde dehydrogenase